MKLAFHLDGQMFFDILNRIIALITTLHTKRKRVLEAGKKFPAADERLMHEAEKKIHQKKDQLGTKIFRCKV